MYPEKGNPDVSNRARAANVLYGLYYKEELPMPWTHDDYPESLKNFTAPIRNKAVDVANALLKDGYDEGRAIAIATAQAKEWGEDHDKQIRKKGH
jgi:hypothetical protein